LGIDYDFFDARNITEYKDLLINHYGISESELKALEKDAEKRNI